MTGVVAEMLDLLVFGLVNVRRTVLVAVRNVRDQQQETRVCWTIVTDTKEMAES